MARTKQTARKSTGGKAPRKQLAIRRLTPPISKLMSKLFRGESVEPPSTRRRLDTPNPPPPTTTPFTAHFTLSKSPMTTTTPPLDTKQTTTKATTTNDDNHSFTHIFSILHDDIYLHLGPHEILSLWRTSPSIWNSISISQRRFILLRSVFAYLRISEEAAHFVTKSIPRGWHEFLPLMVRLCEDLARTYGHLEPDVAHRAFVAEQACFVNGKDGYGRLAAHEVHQTSWGGVIMPTRGRLPDFYDDDGEGEKEFVKKSVTFDHLKSVIDHQVCWGDADSCLGGAEMNDEMTSWLERNRVWMQEHSNEVENVHYRKRLEDGLHPPLWIMFDNGAERVEYALGIGPNFEQFVHNISSYYELSTWKDQREKQTESFWSCFENYHSHGGGGFVEFLVSYPCASECSLDESPSLNMAIWCMRHGIEPFNDKCVDWVDLIKDGKPPGSLDERSLFLFEALTSPEFGLADVENYKDSGNMKEDGSKRSDDQKLE